MSFTRKQLIMIVLAIVLAGWFVNREPFHFEVSPSKTVNCCAKGFAGAPIEFHYDGDNTRFNQCPSDQPPRLLADPYNYSDLGQTYSTTEMFTNDYNPLGKTYPTSEGFNSTYSALGNTYNTREGYQSTQYERYSNPNKYENLSQTGQDLQPFTIGQPKAHHSIYDMYTGGPPAIFNMGSANKEGYCGSCSMV
jgi:hypothetical protein